MSLTVKIIIKLFIIYLCIALSPMVSWGQEYEREKLREYYELRGVEKLTDLSDEDINAVKDSYVEGFVIKLKEKGIVRTLLTMLLPENAFSGISLSEIYGMSLIIMGAFYMGTSFSAPLRLIIPIPLPPCYDTEWVDMGSYLVEKRVEDHSVNFLAKLVGAFFGVVLMILLIPVRFLIDLIRDFKRRAFAPITLYVAGFSGSFAVYSFACYLYTLNMVFLIAGVVLAVISYIFERIFRNNEG